MLRTCLVAIGLISLLGQVVLLRELSVAFFGIELVYLIGFGVWLFATGAGALIGRRAAPGSLAALVLLLVLHAVLLPGELVFLRACRRLLFGVPGAYLPFERGLLVLVLAVVPVGLILGGLFQRSARRFVAEGGTFATAYALESVGGVIGGSAVTLALYWGWDATSLALLCGLIGLVAGATAWGAVARAVRAVHALASLALVCLLPFAPRLDQMLTRLDHPDLAESRDSPYARLTVTRRGDQVSLFVNGALAFETEGVDAEAFVHPVLLQHPHPNRVAVFGGGLDGTIAEVLRHAPRRVDYVELDSSWLDLARTHLPPSRWSALASPAVAVTVTDPRRFLDSADPFDVILIGMPDPDSGQANRFYTTEFFGRCARRLDRGGVLGLKLRAAENLWTPQLARRMTSIHRALQSAFPHTLVLPGTTNVLVASALPLTRDPELLATRLRERGIEGRLVVPGYLSYLMTNDRVDSIARTLRLFPAPANTDRRPVAYTDAALLWLSRFFPRLAYAGADGGMLDARDRAAAARRIPWSVVSGAAAVVATAILLLVGRRTPAGRRTGLAAAAGFSGMVAECVLLLHYQSERGALFQDLGVLLVGFMGGLALGAWGYGAARTKMAKGRGVVLLLAFIVALLGVAAEVRTGVFASLVGITAALTVIGALVGAVLAHASQSGVDDAQGVVSPLYAADLVGGAMGGLVSSLVLIPGLGLDGAVLVAACAIGLAFTLLDREGSLSQRVRQ